MMRRILRTLGGVLLACGLALAGYNQQQDAAAVRASQTLVRRYTAPTAAPDGDTTQGVLELPTLGLTLPVQPDCTPEALQNGPCRQFGSAATDDLVIAGHNYINHFGSLGMLKAGDSVTFTGTDGAVNTYVVSETATISPTETEKVTESGYPLVLYTCTYGRQSRIVIYCSRA